MIRDGTEGVQHIVATEFLHITKNKGTIVECLNCETIEHVNDIYHIKENLYICECCVKSMRL